VNPRPAPDRFDDPLRVADLAHGLAGRGRQAFDGDHLLELAGERIIELVAEAVGAVIDALEEAYPVPTGETVMGFIGKKESPHHVWRHLRV
jgi:hypothetical protein